MKDQTVNKPKILISGANGFIGSHIAELAAARGWDVFAGMRRSGDPSNLQGVRHTRFDLDMNDIGDLQSSMEQAARDHGGFDYVVHCAGVTKPRNHEEFLSGNAYFTRDFATISRDTQPGLVKFIFISSIAALGPGDPHSMVAIDETQVPRPFTPYGRSKLRGEQFLQEIPGLEYMIIRPSAVYGPRDAKFLNFVTPLFKKGLDFRLGPKDQKMSFIHASDLGRAILDACATNVSVKSLNISDGNIYGQEALNEAIMAALGVKCLTVRVPAGVLKSVGRIFYSTMSVLGREVHLSHNKMKEVTARNWAIDITLARQVLNFQPRYDLRTGIMQTLQTG